MYTRRPSLIVNVTRRNVVCDQSLLADRPTTRMVGLLGRRELPSGEGLLLVPATAVHTAFMRFPIDVAFLDPDHRIVKLVPDMKPWRATSARGARAVLELAAGESERRGLRLGDQLSVLELPPSRSPDPELAHDLL
jgi:uncharacterized protein